MFGFSGTRHLQDIDKATACHLIEMYRENETVLRETLLAQSALEEHMRYEQEYADLAAKEDRKAQTKDNRFSPASYPSKLLAASKLFASFQASCEALLAATSDVETKLNGMVASSHEVDPLLIEQVTAIWLSLSAALKALQERLGNTGKEVCILFDQVVGGGGKTWRLSPNDPSKYQAFQDWIVNRAESSSGGSGGEERTYTIESLSAIVDGLEVATPPSEEDPVKQLEAIQGWYEKHQEPYRENLQLLAYRIIHTVYLRHLYTMPTLSASDRIQETLHQRVQQGLLDTYHDLERMKKMHGELRVLANSFPDLLSRTIPTAEHDTHEKRQKFVGIKLEMEGLGSYFEARIRRLEETLQELERTLPKDLVRGVKIALREERRPALNAGESHPQVVIISPSDTGDISLRASLISSAAAPSVLMQPLRAQHDEQQVADSPSTAPPKGGKKSAAAPQEPPSKRQSATASPLPAAARESSSKSSTTPSAQLAPPTAGSSSASASHASLQASRQLAEISEASHSFRKVFKGEQISDLILDPLKSHFERD